MNKINEKLLTISKTHIALKAPFLLRTLSSAVLGAGIGYYDTFVNLHVDKNYRSLHYRDDLIMFIQKNNYNPDQTIGMMTAVETKDLQFKLYAHKDFSVFIVVTAGTGNAVDSTNAYKYHRNQEIGTINTWLFINGNVTDEALVQAIITATEAKTKALYDEKIYDPLSKTIATGTSTDSVVVATTGRGTFLPYAGAATSLGQLIGKGVYELTKKAIGRS